MLKKRICCLLLVFVLCFSITANALEVASRGAISINSETGEIYFEKNAYALMTPASLTKIMTLYLLFEKMAAGEVTEDTLLPVSKNAAKLSRAKGATNIPLKAGSSVSVRTLIDSIVLVSACASCTVVAEYISGSETKFAALMTQRAREMGINACFFDASGISNKNTITPIGVVTLVKIFITTHPEILTYTSKPSVTIDGKTYKTTNFLLENSGSQYSYPGVDGFKKGSTKKAGKCLVSTTVKGNTRIICVVMNAPSDYYRFIDSQKLIADASGKIDHIERNLFSTDIRTYINNTEIPCVYKYAGTNGVMVLINDIESYGFDIVFDEANNTVFINENKEEEIVPVQREKAKIPGAERKISDSSAKVYLVKDSVQTELTNVVLTDLGFAVSFDELGSFYEKLWDGETRSVHLNK